MCSRAWARFLTDRGRDRRAVQFYAAYVRLVRVRVQLGAVHAPRQLPGRHRDVEQSRRGPLSPLIRWLMIHP